MRLIISIYRIKKGSPRWDPFYFIQIQFMLLHAQTGQRKEFRRCNLRRIE